jgi:hypothetical protein
MCLASFTGLSRERLRTCPTCKDEAMEADIIELDTLRTDTPSELSDVVLSIRLVANSLTIWLSAMNHADRIPARVRVILIPVHVHAVITVHTVVKPILVICGR